MALPNAYTFADPLERWVYETCASSVVYIEFRPDPDRVLDRWNALYPLPDNAVQQRLWREQQSALTLYGTAFFVPSVEPDNGLGVYLVTSAHVFAPVFNEQVPISAAELNVLYEPCDHREQRYLAGLEINGERNLRFGRFHAISCTNDLQLMRIARHAFRWHCDQPHPWIPIAGQFPEPLSKAVMISCPGVGRSLTSALGRVSRAGRPIAELAGLGNRFGFTTNLSEVDITSEDGSSGGPLLDGSADVCGVLHGGNTRFSSGGPLLDGSADVCGVLHGGNTRFSCYVGLPEFRETLADWGIIPEELL